MAGSRFCVGSRVLYWSDRQGKECPATVTKINMTTGELQLDIKPGQWLPPEVVKPMATDGLRPVTVDAMRPITVDNFRVTADAGRPHIVDNFRDPYRVDGLEKSAVPKPDPIVDEPLQVGDKVYMYSQSKERYIPAVVVAAFAEDGSVELDVKRGARLSIAEQEQRIRRTYMASQLRIGDEVTFWTDKEVHDATVTQVNNTTGDVQLSVSPGVWCTPADQRRQVRVFRAPFHPAVLPAASPPRVRAGTGMAAEGAPKAITAQHLGAVVGQPAAASPSGSPATPRNSVQGTKLPDAGSRPSDPGLKENEHFPAGTMVKYYSSSAGDWIDAQVKGFNHDGTYNLDVHPKADRAKVKAADGKDGKVIAGQQNPEAAKHEIEGTIVAERPNIKWEDIAGLETAKDQLKLAVVLPAKFPQMFSEDRPPPRGILMYGPPGTGKTHLAMACASACTSTFFQVKPSDIMSKFQGESEKHVAKLFEVARQKAPSMVFIDEIDAFFGKRSKDEGGSSRAVKNVFLQSMEQFMNQQKAGKMCLVLGATNMPWDLDDAFLRRFQAKIYIPLPDIDGREYLLKLVLGETKHDLRPEDFRVLAKQTDGFSGSDIKNLAQCAIMKPVVDLQHSRAFQRRSVAVDGMPKLYWVPCSPTDPGAIAMSLLDIEEGEPYVRPVTLADFQAAQASVKTSIQSESLPQFEEWTQKYGSRG